MVSGFLLVDKGSGWTSHDVVARVRALTRIRRVGHAGTLDPMATGLLVLGLERATRLLRFIQELSKEYVARALFGVATDTLDADGAILSREPMPFSHHDLESVLPRFVGRIMQVPPMMSALKVGGRKLYDLARHGEEIDREARPVDVYGMEVVEFAPSDYPEAVFRVSCGAGTYIRTLVDDIARSLGGRAHLVALRRNRIGSLRADQAVRIDELEGSAGSEPFLDHVLPAADGLVDFPAVTVPEQTARGVSHGASFPIALLGADAAERGVFRILEQDGGLLAMYRVEGKQARPEVILA